MTVTNYVVPHHGFGTPRRLTVDTVNPEMFLQLLSLAESSHLPVTLSGHSSTGFRVHHGEDIVGVIPASQAADYSELDWIIDAGLTPQATAEIALREDAAEETIPAFEVLLPEPGLCVPLNIPPAQRWGMLSGQRALHITEFAVPASSLPTHPAHLLVRLTNNRHFFRRSIEVHLDDELVATIPRERAPWLSDTIAGFNHEGLIAVARAYFISDGQPTLTVYSEEGTPESHFAVGTAGIIAAAAGAAAVKVTNSGKAHAASLPAGGIEATGAAKTAGTAATQSAQALSLNSAGAAAVTGTKIAAASTGLKVACAAGVAVVVGGAANFASSGNSSGSHHDNLAESAFEENTLAVSTSHSADVDAAAIEDIVAADAHLPEERDDTDATQALSPTGFSEPTEPTELTEPAEPTELAEPTERTPLPAAEEVATSPQADHLPHTAPTTAAPRTTEPTAEELDTPEARRTEAFTAPSSSPTNSATPRSTVKSTESTTSREVSRSAEPPTTTRPPSAAPQPHTTPPIHVPRPTSQTQATPSPTVVTTTPKPPAEPTPSTSKAAPTTTPVGEDRTAPHDEPTAPSTPPATTPVTTRVSTPPTAAPAPSTTSAPATPTPTTKPKPTSKPKPTTKPTPTTDPKPTTKPQLTNEPRPTAKPKPTTEPTPTAKPTPTSKPKPTTQPQPTRKPEPTKEPEPSREPDPTPEQSDRGGWVIIIDFG